MPDRALWYECCLEQTLSACFIGVSVIEVYVIEVYVIEVYVIEVYVIEAAA